MLFVFVVFLFTLEYLSALNRKIYEDENNFIHVHDEHSIRHKSEIKSRIEWFFSE